MYPGFYRGEIFLDQRLGNGVMVIRVWYCELGFLARVLIKDLLLNVGGDCSIHCRREKKEGRLTMLGVLHGIHLCRNLTGDMTIREACIPPRVFAFN